MDSTVITLFIKLLDIGQTLKFKAPGLLEDLLKKISLPLKLGENALLESYSISYVDFDDEDVNIYDQDMYEEALATAYQKKLHLQVKRYQSTDSSPLDDRLGSESYTLERRGSESYTLDPVLCAVKILENPQLSEFSRRHHEVFLSQKGFTPEQIASAIEIVELAADSGTPQDSNCVTTRADPETSTTYQEAVEEPDQIAPEEVYGGFQNFENPMYNTVIPEDELKVTRWPESEVAEPEDFHSKAENFEEVISYPVLDRKASEYKYLDVWKRAVKKIWWSSWANHWAMGKRQDSKRTSKFDQKEIDNRRRPRIQTAPVNSALQNERVKMSTRKPSSPGRTSRPLRQRTGGSISIASEGNNDRKAVYCQSWASNYLLAFNCCKKLYCCTNCHKPHTAPIWVSEEIYCLECQSIVKKEETRVDNNCPNCGIKHERKYFD